MAALEQQIFPALKRINALANGGVKDARILHVKKVTMELCQRVSAEDAPLGAVVLFVSAWLLGGNYWSLVASQSPVSFSFPTMFLWGVLYAATAIPVIYFCFRELFRLKTMYKWIIITQIGVFFLFVIAPPRNADAMRVWLAKVYDVWMNGKNFLRPYFHYFTPDAFTLYHLPLINLWDGQVFQLSIWTALCAILILILKIGRIYSPDNVTAIGLCLFLANPLIILSSTVILSDLPIILAVAGTVYAMALYEQGRFHQSLALVILFIAFGMNIKYNMLMFLPVLFYWMAKKIWMNGICWKSLPISMLLMALAVLPYASNYFSIGNPVWPALINLFPSTDPYLDQVGLLNSQPFLGGERSVLSFVISFGKLFLMPEHINPLAMATVFFVFAKYRYLGALPAVLVGGYLVVLWLMMPEFAGAEKERYILYLFPIIIPLGTARMGEILSAARSGRWKKYLVVAVVSSIFFYLAFALAYSFDAARYAATFDKKSWHRATWYYEDYDWINQNITLDKTEKVLVIVLNQQTYYLKKPYLNADSLSALIDWQTVNGLPSMRALLDAYHIRYLFVDVGCMHENARKSIEGLSRTGELRIMRENQTPIVYSRLRNIFQYHQTAFYQVVKP